MKSAALARLSVIVPVLDAAASLAATLASVAGVADMIVVDGGSTDDSVAIAEGTGARVVRAARGRGGQMAAGAAAAQGDWLLFLHADTVLERDWETDAAAFMAEANDVRRAAAFRFALDDATPQARRLERLVAARCRWLALPYGDQGLLIARAFYDELGGFKAMPLMEDVDIVQRIGRRRLVMLKAAAVTSAERWHRDGWLRRSARNLMCLSLYSLGVAPERIERIYRPRRSGR